MSTLNSARPTLLKQMGGKYIQSSEATIEKFSQDCKQLDMVVEAAGIAKLDFDLIHILGINGIYVLTGVPGDQRPMNVDGASLMRQLVMKNQVILGSVNAGLNHFKKAIEDLEGADQKWSGLMEKLITSKTPYSDFSKVISHHDPDEIKAIIEWSK